MNVLEKIVAEKRPWIEARKCIEPLDTFRDKLVPAERDFYGVLEARKRSGIPAFILECKKASPSRGLIRANFDPAEIASVYARRADVISVLCDEKFFSGRFENIPIVRGIAQQPVICKDFIVDPYQIFLARKFGADAILLMLSVLSDAEYAALADVAHSLGMGILTEADSPEDVVRANALGARVVGINNRNLRTLKTDIARTRELAGGIRTEAVRVAESGIGSHADALATAPFADAFLVGSSLMKEPKLDRACRALVFGENKVCGLTRAENALAARDAGAVFGGLIFAEKSPRKISPSEAKKIIAATPDFDFVGVFQNQYEDFILETTRALGLFAVQLHGAETIAFAKTLREKLPAKTQIWKAISARALASGTATEFFENPVFDRFVLDSGNGGTGTVFDWNAIPSNVKTRAMLAGGISPENARQAHRVGCVGIEFNSGVESSLGEKSSEKIAAAFAELRKF